MEYINDPKYLEDFEARGTWDSKGRAWLDGKRAAQFDIIDETGRTADDHATRETIFTVLVSDTIITASQELALVTRIEDRDGITQVYGLYLTGPLNNSTNAVGELNEFLLTLDAPS